MIGSALVVFTWAYPIENRNKHGRILLFWLSIADFMSSLFYIIQTFDNVTDKPNVCEALALIDIFFPVASFLWTDFIAYYLYLVVQNRTASYAFSWKRLLVAFHVIAWSVSLLVVLLVLFTRHAGRNNDDSNDDKLDNTGGWCWIEANDKQERFVWELIGGKLVEWISGLIVVPVLYIFVAVRLYQIDKRQIKTTSSTLNLSDNNKKSFLSAVSGPEDLDVMNAMRSPPLNFAPSSSNSEANAKHRADQEDDVSDLDSRDGSQRMGYEDDSMRYSNGFASEYDNSEHQLSSLDSLHSVVIEEDEDDDDQSREFSFNENPGGQTVTQTGRGVRVTGTKGKYFNRFYLKLFLLPIVFIFVRFWSSLRVLLVFFDEKTAANNGFLAVMQAFFDPSQGFFNSILFVFFSRSDRNRLIATFKHLGHSIYQFCCSKKKEEDENNPKNFRLETLVRNNSQNRRMESPVGRPTSVVGGVGVSLPSNLKENLVNNSLHSDANRLSNTMNPILNRKSFSRKSDASEEIAIEDLEGDFECDDDNRLSDFSFDSRMDSVSAPATSMSSTQHRLDG